MAPSSELRENAGKALGMLEMLGGQQIRNADWATKIMFVCETIWEALDHDGMVTVAQEHVFASMLRDPEILPLAGAMIPELRSEEEAEKATKSPQKENVIRLTGAHKPNLAADSIDSAMYRAEKNAFYDADVYRTMLFLRRSERFTEEEILAIRRWLDACPVKSKKDKAVRSKEGSDH